MLHEAEKNPKAPPSIADQEKAQLAAEKPMPGHPLKSKSNDAKSATADAHLGCPGDLHPHQDGDVAPKVEEKAPEAPPAAEAPKA